MIYYTKRDLQEIKNLETSFNENNISFLTAQYLLGDYALPDRIMAIKEDIERTSLDENFSTTPNDEEGYNLMQTVLKTTAAEARKLVADPKTAGICLRALRNKYEDLYFKSQRARAEDRGFIATVLYTIKRAIYWIIKKFQDLKDEVIDVFKDRPEYSSRAKRDYLWLKDQSDKWLANNTSWYNDSEY